MYKSEISSERKAFILISVLFLNLILISTNVVLENRKTLLQNIIGEITTPFQVAFQKISNFFSGQIKHYIFLQDAYEKYADIKKEYRRLKYENYKLRKKIQDNNFLSSLEDTSHQLIAADVIAIDRDFPLGHVVIDKGSKNGISKGMTVLNGDAQLVGRIVEPVTFFTARVRLITSSVGGVGAYIKKNKLEGLLTGNNSNICFFKYLIENKPVALGDEVVTSGTDRLFPAYLPIGTVVKISKEYLVQEVYVQPYFVEKSIKKLIIIKDIPEAPGPQGGKR